DRTVRDDRHRGVAVAVAVGVAIGVALHALVERAVAVVVEPVADLGQAGVRAGAHVVAGGAAGRAVAARARDVPVGVEIAVAVGAGIAILVDVVDVADLGVAGVAPGVLVGAVRAAAVDRERPVAVGVDAAP